jgi:hypothetical protein
MPSTKESSSSCFWVQFICISDAKWNNHIENIILSVSRYLGILRKLKYRLSRQNLEKLYLVYIRPIFEYGLIVIGMLFPLNVKFNNLRFILLDSIQTSIPNNNNIDINIDLLLHGNISFSYDHFIDSKFASEVKFVHFLNILNS